MRRRWPSFRARVARPPAPPPLHRARSSPPHPMPRRCSTLPLPDGQCSLPRGGPSLVLTSSSTPQQRSSQPPTASSLGTPCTQPPGPVRRRRFWRWPSHRTLLQEGDSWPLGAEAIPRSTSGSLDPPRPGSSCCRRQMSASRRGWRGTPCTCTGCLQTGAPPAAGRVLPRHPPGGLPGRLWSGPAGLACSSPCLESRSRTAIRCGRRGWRRRARCLGRPRW
mmetsp:Transcript_2306/g.4692  ORF Transcript_2306/g.4692 Transcript_2306/m.4692 type:complete len:221 (+) Transcript_2306:108-770(+)